MERRRIIQISHSEDGNIGLYSVPIHLTESEFMTEWNKYPDQDAFDEENQINAEREFVDEYFIDNPF
jgi:hypothetical protein